MALLAPPGTVPFRNKWSDSRKEANEAPLAAVTSVQDLIDKYRGGPAEVQAGIKNAIIGVVVLASALSMIPFTSNFAGDFAGSVLRDLASPGVNMCINAPIVDYLENLFPTRELNVRLLVTGVEKGALSDADLIDTAVDSGIKDKEIVKLVKIAKVARFDKETADAYRMLDRYMDAFISAQITIARAEIDEGIADRKAEISEWKKIMREQAMEAAAS